MIEKAEKHLAQDPVIGPLLARYGPCQLALQTDYFQVLCNSIISQQISVKAAEAIFGRFKEHLAGEITPARVAEFSAEDLKTAGVSMQKAKYLLDLAQKFLLEEVRYHDFGNLANEEIIAELVKVKGIGRWTAEMFLIFALNRSDVLPVDDLGIRKAVQVQYGLAELASAAQIREIAVAWHPYETLACWYLWRSLENDPRSDI